jgi:hypothetical protein
MHNENSCLNYRTKTYQVVTNGIYVSKVDSIIANSKVEPLGSRTYENGKLISAYYPPNNQFRMYSKEQQEHHIYNDKGNVLMDIMKLGSQIDTTFYTYNENGKLSELRKKTLFFDDPLTIVQKYSYSNDSIYKEEYWNGKHESTQVIWEQQKIPKTQVYQIIYPEKSNILNKYVWDEHLNLTEMIHCENDSCYTSMKIDFTYDDCGRVIKKTSSYDPDKNTIWSIEWNEIIE